MFYYYFFFHIYNIGFDEINDGEQIYYEHGVCTNRIF